MRKKWGGIMKYAKMVYALYKAYQKIFPINSA